MKEENPCYELRPEKLEVLPPGDSLKTIYDKQEELQERLGMMSLYRASDMHRKCKLAIENVFHLNVELVEMMERLPFKYWKTYPEGKLNDWGSEEQRVETLFEYIDALHFFLNIGLVFGFTAEEIFHFYKAKNKENFDRQERGY